MAIRRGTRTASPERPRIPNLTRGCRPYGVVDNVVTHRDAHRAPEAGYGKAVLAEALSVAWSQGCYKVMLLTGRKDEATFQFYASAGFNPHDQQAFIAKAPSSQPDTPGGAINPVRPFNTWTPP